MGAGTICILARFLRVVKRPTDYLTGGFRDGRRASQSATFHPVWRRGCLALVPFSRFSFVSFSLAVGLTTFLPDALGIHCHTKTILGVRFARKSTDTAQGIGCIVGFPNFRFEGAFLAKVLCRLV